jgi:hypothetical protein
MSSATHIILSGGAQASNVFWVVAGQTTIGTTAVFSGNLLDQTTIVLNTGAVLNGRALAQAAVTLDASTVTASAYTYTAPPTPVAVVTSIPTSTSTPTSTLTLNPAVVLRSSASSSASVSSDATVNAGLQTQLDGLLSTLQSLRTQAAQQGVSSSNLGQQVSAIVNSLGTGSISNDVTTLQQFLIAQNKGAAAQNLARVGATGYFGALTNAALAEFQASVGISPALGNFGAITRAFLSTHY